MLNKALIALLCFGLYCPVSLADNNLIYQRNDVFSHHFYLGLTGGYGWTTWGGLVPLENKQNIAINMSTPKIVHEGGGLWGLYTGYEISPHFALEFSYMHYPNAKISFDETSLFSFEHPGSSNFITRTQTLSLMAKIMLVIPQTTLRVYSSLGAAEVHRKDNISNHYRLSPVFGAGVSYVFDPHFMVDVGTDYTAGYGESELNPAQNYFPFLYSFYLRLAYRI